MVAAAHPNMIINMLDEEAKITSSDGFMSRFLLCVPQPSRISLKDLTSFTTISKNSMISLFITIKLLHTQSILYKFDKDAFEYLSDCVDNQG